MSWVTSGTVRGPQGAQGETGSPGEPGAAGNNLISRFTTEDYTTLLDGNRLTLDEQSFESGVGAWEAHYGVYSGPEPYIVSPAPPGVPGTRLLRWYTSPGAESAVRVNRAVTCTAAETLLLAADLYCAVNTPNAWLYADFFNSSGTLIDRLTVVNVPLPAERRRRISGTVTVPAGATGFRPGVGVYRRPGGSASLTYLDNCYAGPLRPFGETGYNAGVSSVGANGDYLIDDESNTVIGPKVQGRYQRGAVLAASPVTSLRGRNVSNDRPQTGDTLTFDGTSWAPASSTRWIAGTPLLAGQWTGAQWISRANFNITLNRPERIMVIARLSMNVPANVPIISSINIGSTRSDVGGGYGGGTYADTGVLIEELAAGTHNLYHQVYVNTTGSWTIAGGHLDAFILG